MCDVYRQSAGNGEMGKYMPQRVFEAGAASIAKAHILKGVSIEEYAKALWEKWYKQAYVDDGVLEDWICAAKEAGVLLDEL